MSESLLHLETAYAVLRNERDVLDEQLAKFYDESLNQKIETIENAMNSIQDHISNLQ